MGTNITGIGNANAIGFKSRVTGGIYFPPELKDALVGVWSAYGKSNDSTDRNIIKNKIKNRGGDFVISNAAFKLNSGYGKYEEDFTSWDRIDASTAEISNDGSKIKCINTILNVQYLFNSINKDIPSFKVKISNFTKGNIAYYYRKEDGTEAFLRIEPSPLDKVLELPKSYNTVEGGTGSRGGFYSSNINIGVTIEQIPSFQGAFVTDGINDLITSTKSATEMLDGSNEITVVSMIHQIKTNSDGTRNNRFFTPVSYLENRVVENKTGKTGIYGYTSTNVTNAQISDITPILGDKNDYTLYSKIEDGDRDYFTVEGFQNQGIWYVSSIAWYWTFIAKKVLTTDQINQVIAYFNLDRTLKPDILCNTIKQGITNDNHAEFGDKLIDFSGNGRDIQLNNLAWKGDSGIGKYAADFTSWTTPKEVQKTSDTVKITTEYTEHWVAYLAPNNTFKSMKVLISGIPDGGALQFFRTTADGGSIKMVNGINEIPEFTNTVAAGFYIDVPLGFDWSNLVIEQIPSHAGALCLDGVNDFGKVTGMPIYKDYTFIIDYERISYTSPEVWTAGVVSKAHTVGQGAFILMLANREVELSRQSNSFGSTTTFNRDDFTRTLLYQSKYKCGDVNLTIGEGIDGDTLWLGTLRDNDYRFFNGAIYSLMSFPYSMSKFLIERQLKKHKLGTLYPDMVEFRPVIKKDDRIKSIKYYIDGKIANIGQYYPIGSGLGIAVETVQPYMVKSLKVNGVNTIPNADYKGFNARLDSKSPQKITMDIQVDTNLIQWNPIITSTAELTTAPTFAIRGTSTLLKAGDWIPKNSEIWVIVTMNNLIDELRKFSFNGTFIHIPSSSYNPDTGKYGFPFVIDNESPQNINLTIDEYIRFEDIVQPYPALLRFNDENGNEVSWGGKFRVGSTITRIGSAADSNLLPNIYNVFGLLLNDNQVTSSKVIVEKTMVFKAKSAYIFDNNEPNCILSPRLLRIPNSSYKILGHIPDISGHGNNGVIHNSAYAEGSGVNEDGSYQFDGVDDFVTIPTLSSGGKQVLMKVNLPRLNEIIYDQRKETNTYTFAILTIPSQIAYDQCNSERITYIDGILNTNIIAEQLMGVTHNIVVINSKANLDNTRSPILGRDINGNNWSRMRIYDFMLFDGISTDDKIKELNEYVGIEAKVELPPYYWDAYGKTNLDEDKATIQQRGVAVGDYDLTNYNHAYDKMSGYGGYSLGRFDKSWASSSLNNTNVIVVSRNPYDITLKKLGGNSDWEFNNTELKVISNPVSVKFKSNKNIRVTCDYHYYPVGGNSEGAPLGITSKDLIANKDAIITISPISQENIDKYNIDINRGYYLIYFQLSPTLAVNEEVTIEMLPLYPNGLVLDGVEDFSKNANIPALTDYTYILKRQILKGIANSAVMYKGNITVNQGGAFICNYCEPSDTNLFTDFSFGGLLRSNDIDKPIIYGTKTSVNGDSITPGENIDTVGINVGKWVNYLPMVFYKLILYPKTIPLLQINFLKNLMEKDEIIDLTNPIFIKNE